MGAKPGRIGHGPSADRIPGPVGPRSGGTGGTVSVPWTDGCPLRSYTGSGHDTTGTGHGHRDVSPNSTHTTTAVTRGVWSDR